MNKPLDKALKAYEPFIKAISELFYPFIEIAVHDLKSGKIVALYQNLSRRKVGESSPLHELGVETDQFPDYFVPYTKINWNGGHLKCTTVTVRDDKQRPIGIICINFDTSSFQDIQRTIEKFITVPKTGENPIEIYGVDSQEKIQTLIDNAIRKNDFNASDLKREDKKKIVQHLFEKGAFNFKNAVPLISDCLKVSRATVYNYIQRIRS